MSGPSQIVGGEELRAQAGIGATIYTDQLPQGATALRRAAPALPCIYLKGIPLHAITEVQAVQYVLDQLEAGQGGWVITPNLDHLRRLSHDQRFKQLYRQASLIVADGMPLVWASRLQGTPLPERVAGSNLINSLSAAAGERGRSVYLLGGDPGTAEKAADILRERYRSLRIAGTHCPPIGFDNDETQVEELIRRLNQADPDIVYVALGSPKQEWLIGRLREHLPRAWWLGIGISFSFVSGHVQRAPLWMQRTGLEWLHRLSQEPRRLAKRYLLHGLPFAASLLVDAAFNRLLRRNRNGTQPPTVIENCAEGQLLP